MSIFRLNVGADAGLWERSVWTGYRLRPIIEGSMDAVELERRRRVWVALSDVFLDTETRTYFPRIAGVLAGSGYSQSELDQIWRHEMVPECIGNLLQVAGEWGAIALDEAALIKRALKPPNVMASVAYRIGAALVSVSEEWKQILALYAILVIEPEAERSRLVAAWSAFAEVYLSDEHGLLSFEWRSKSLQVVGSRAFCQETFVSDFRPIYSKLLTGEEKSVEAERATNVEKLIESAFTR